MRVPLLGFMLDADPTTPGAIMDGDVSADAARHPAANVPINELRNAAGGPPTGAYATRCCWMVPRRLLASTE